MKHQKKRKMKLVSASRKIQLAKIKKKLKQMKNPKTINLKIKQQRKGKKKQIMKKGTEKLN